MSALKIALPKWAVPLTKPCRLKGVKGGRGSGKSHTFAELLIARCLAKPNTRAVCLREIQKSINMSVKTLLDDKIEKLGVSEYFHSTDKGIRSTIGSGSITFAGLQNHTVDSIKSVEGVNIAWVEEAQSVSSHSLDILLPTIRAAGSEVWFSWNPEQPDDPVEQLFRGNDNATLIHVNYTENPFCTDVIREQAEWQKRMDYERYNHIWLGGYNVASGAQIFSGHWSVDSFTPDESFGLPLYGLDFGFSVDPTAGVELYIKDNYLFIHAEAAKVGLTLDDTAQFLLKHMPLIQKHVCYADSSRPESIDYLKRHGLPLIKPVQKKGANGKGFIESGIEFLKTFDKIVIHERCEKMIEEARCYSYKIDKRTEEITREIKDEKNHLWDAVRYGISPLVRKPHLTSAPVKWSY